MIPENAAKPEDSRKNKKRKKGETFWNLIEILT
jgi:hypothetical protein